MLVKGSTEKNVFDKMVNFVERPSMITKPTQIAAEQTGEIEFYFARPLQTEE